MELQAHFLAPSDIDHLHDEPEIGERWRYSSPIGHKVAWLVPDEAEFRTPDTLFGGCDEVEITSHLIIPGA
jgi:hypothetical protein